VLRPSIIGLVAMLAPLLTRADTPIRLDLDDVQFQFGGVSINGPGQSPHLPTKTPRNHLCGFVINGNHRSRENPHVEWDINIDQIVTPNLTVAGVSAGSFDVKDHKRQPRSPITQLSFTLHGVPDPVVAEIRGVPNAANGIVALIQPGPAKQLFAEFQTERAIIVSLGYADHTSEQLEVHGFRDRRMFGAAHNTYFEECLQGFKTINPNETITYH
jgi:hypothetical protein